MAESKSAASVSRIGFAAPRLRSATAAKAKVGDEQLALCGCRIFNLAISLPWGKTACARLRQVAEESGGKTKFLTLALLITAITTPCADLSRPDGSHDRHALRDRSGDF
jgi:hypothetical protein